MVTKTTQEFVPIKEIRDGIIILKNNAMISILMASSLNFALKSIDEQTATIMQFQNFLNSLDFSVQFYIESRELDIRPYMALLEERFLAQVNDLMKIQTREYIEFIKNFTKNQEIMTKHFFISIPYHPPVIGAQKSILGFFGKKKEENLNKDRMSFEENRSQLEQRVAMVSQGLTSSGVKTIQLGTEELIELFYKIFNPGDLEKPITTQKN